MKPFVLKIEKPWGYEIIFTPPDSSVTGKILHIKAGGRLSLQYHEEKEETLMLCCGECLLIAENEKGSLEEIKMEPQKGYFIKKLQKHRCSALSDCDIIEASTPEIGKTIRVEDDYSRGTETDEERQKNRI